MRLLIFALALLLAGCATRPRPIPIPPVQTVALQDQIKRAGTSTGSAKTRIQKVTAQVDALIPRVEPAIAQELTVVRAELFRATAELREAQEAVTAAESERVATQDAANKLATFAQDQAKLAVDYADSLRKAEVRVKVAEKKAFARGNAAWRNLIGGGLGTLLAAAMWLKPWRWV